MEQEIALTADAQEAMAEGVELCRRANLAIFTPEHMLAGALLVLSRMGMAGLPAPASIEAALAMIHGTSEEVPPDEISFSPGARSILDSLAQALANAGRVSMGAREVALAVVVSGEATPMFFGAMGTTKDELLIAVSGVREHGRG